MLLSHIAMETFENDEYFIPQRAIESLIKDFIQHMPSVNKDKIDIDSNKILKAIEAHHGLLVERASRVYSFRT